AEHGARRSRRRETLASSPTAPWSARSSPHEAAAAREGPRVRRSGPTVQRWTRPRETTTRSRGCSSRGPRTSYASARRWARLSLLANGWLPCGRAATEGDDVAVGVLDIEVLRTPGRGRERL